MVTNSITKINLVAGLCLILNCLAPTGALAQGDAAAGEKLFKKCRSCHKIGEGAKHSVGPNLTGVVGRAMGGADGYKYGKGLQAANAADGVWSEELITRWLMSPKDFIRAFTGDDSAKTKMSFNLKSVEEAQNVAAYLATFSDSSD